MKCLPLFFLLAFPFVPAACARDSESFGADPDTAVSLVRADYSAEKWHPDSTNIHTVEYFPESPRRFLIVTFHRRGGGASKPYLYEGVPSHHWNAWRKSSSAGKWYNANLKGRYQFRPSP